MSRRALRLRTLAVITSAATAVLASSLGGGHATVQASSQAAFCTGPSGAPPCWEKQIPGNPFVDGVAGSYAWGAAAMPDGTIIIGDIWNRRVLHYDTGGNLISTTAAPGGVLFQQQNGDAPYGLSVDPRNPLNIGGQVLPRQIFVGRQFPAGPEIWTADATTGVYTLTGHLHDQAMRYPSRVQVRNDGHVYVSDELDNQVFVFDGDTHSKIGVIGVRGTAQGQFIQPRGMAFDANNNLYVMDCNNWRIEAFHPDGTFWYEFDNRGTTAGTFHGNNTRGIAIDAARNLLFVSDVAAGTVHEFDISGAPTVKWIQDIGHPDNIHGFPAPLGGFVQGGRELAIDGSSHLWVGDMPDFRAQVFDYTTNPIKAKPLFMTPNPVVLPPDGAFNDPRGITIDSLGDMYVADTHNFRLEKFDPNGVWQWSLGYRGRINPDTFNYTRNLAADPSPQPCVQTPGSTCNVFYVADTYNFSIDKYEDNGSGLAPTGPVWQIAAQGKGPGQFGYPSGVGVGPDLSKSTTNSVFVADSRNQRIQVLDPGTGAYVRQFPCKPCTDPRGVAVDPATGNVYVADISAALYEFNNAGTQLINTLATKGTNPGQVSSASDVVLDSTYVYVTDSNAGRVDAFNLSDGKYAFQFGTPGGRLPGNMGFPSALAVDPVNHWVYVSEEYNDRVSAWCISSC